MYSYCAIVYELGTTVKAVLDADAFEHSDLLHIRAFEKVGLDLPGFLARLPRLFPYQLTSRFVRQVDC